MLVRDICLNLPDNILTRLVVVWDDAEIAVNFFPHGSVPSDLEADAPLPDTWGVPMARWPSTTCDTSKFFQNHSVIIDTTLWLVVPVR